MTETFSKLRNVRGAKGKTGIGFTLRLFLKNKLALIGTIITLIYFGIALLDFIYPQYLGVANISSVANFLHTTTLNPSALPTPPTFSNGWWYWFGTTEYGVPILPAMLAALKVDMGYSVLIVLTAAAIGLFVGTASGYLGGLVDELLMRVTDVFFGIPTLVLAIAIIYVLGRGIDLLAIALIIVRWPMFARLSRGNALSVKQSKYIEAAQAYGSSGLRNMFAHVMPNILSPIYVQVSLELGTVVLTFSTLDFLGFNFANPLIPELGSMIAGFGGSGATSTFLAFGLWWPMVIPGIFLLIFTISVNLLGDGLRDILDPKLRR